MFLQAAAKFITLPVRNLRGNFGQRKMHDIVVVHLLAGHLVDLSPMLGELQTRSRDFH